MDEDRVIEKMKQLVAQAQKLQNVKTSSDDFKKWKTSVRAFLKRLGEDYLEEFEDIRFTPMAYTIGCGDGVFVEACREGINSTIAYLNSQIEDIREWGLPEEKTKVMSGRKSGMQISITQNQSQAQAAIFSGINLDKYDKETQRKAKELFDELEKPHKNKLKISNIIKYLADKAVDVLITIMVSRSGLA